MISSIAYCLAALTVLADARTPESRLGKDPGAFTLRDVQGAVWNSADHIGKKSVAVIFMGTECPLAKLYAPKIQELSDEFGKKGVEFALIFPNQQDSLLEIQAFGRLNNLSIPLLKDVGNKVADQFGAERTPEVFLIGSDGKVAYWGRIDDQFGVGYTRLEVRRRDLALAIGELLEGKKITLASTQAPGCLIGRAKSPTGDQEVTFSNQIVRIFQKRCQECHHEGSIGPFSLMNYEDAAGWAPMIAEVVSDQRMPPWHANPAHGKFANDPRLSDLEKSQIARWVEAGAPEGDKSLLPTEQKFVPGWRIPNPDVVLSFRKPIDVPATGVVDYINVRVPTNFTEDKWVQFAEAIPGAPGVVHHIIVFISPPMNGSNKGRGGFSSRWLVATAPGARPMELADGYAKLIPAGSSLVFQMHYTPNGVATTDVSKIGLKFVDPKLVRKQVINRDPGQFAFRIPPHAEDYKMVATTVFREDSRLLSFFPHMHMRGKSFRYEVIYPSGEQEILLDVPRYDFGWQNRYELAEPKLMPAGTKMICTAHYDNSENNLSNPNPNQSVTWGEQTWNEMMFGFFEMAFEDQDLQKSLSSPEKSRLDRFVELVHAGKLASDPALFELAKQAFVSDKNFRSLFSQLQKTVPQLDRMCVTVVDHEVFRVTNAVQDRKVRSGFALSGYERPITGFELVKIATAGKLMSITNLSLSKGADLLTMSRVFTSSLHIPLKLAGNDATLNFWSTEKDAFPAEAIEFLQKIAQQITEANDSAADKSRAQAKG